MVKNTADNMNYQNFHILTVKYISQTNALPSRVKIISERFRQSKTIEYDHDFANTLEIAENWIEKNGYKIIGHAEGKNCYYVITDTFKSPQSK